jgi:hypothetical protein
LVSPDLVIDCVPGESSGRWTALNRPLILALLAGFAAFPPAGAQQPDTVRVLAAATTFIRDSVITGHGRIVIDETFHVRSPGVSAEAAENVARTVGATRGRWKETIQCTETHRPRCVSKGNATVIAFGSPTIRDSTATVEFSYHYVDVRDRPQMGELELKLGRASDGKWRVTAVRETGAS